MLINLKLDKLLKDKGVSKYQFAKTTGLTHATVDNLCKNKDLVSIRLNTLEVICDTLDCDINDVLEYKPKIA